MSALAMSGDRRYGFTVYLLLALLGVFHYELVSYLLGFWWENASYGHGLLIMPIIAYLLWHERGALHLAGEANPYLSAFMVLGVTVVWSLAILIDVMLVQQIAFVSSIVLILYILFGLKGISIIALPLSVLYLAVPMWSFVEGVLQDMTAVAAVFLVRLVGVSAYIEGSTITIPEGVFVVETVCAGLRFVLALMTLLFLYSYVYIADYKKRILFIVSGFILAVVTNWLRVFIVIMAGHYSNMENVLVESHVWFGWVVFAVILIPVFYLGNKLSSGDRLQEKSQKIKRSFYVSGFNKVIIAVLIIFPSLSYINISTYIQVPQEKNITLSQVVAGLHNIGGSQVQIGTSYEGADNVVFSNYAGGSEQYGVYIAEYHSQSTNHELINYDNKLYDDGEWKKQFEEDLMIVSPDGYEVTVKRLHLKSRTYGDRLLTYWYEVAGVATTSKLVAKLLQLKQVVNGGGARVYVISGSVADINNDFLSGLMKSGRTQ